MTSPATAVVEKYLKSLDACDWPTFASTLADNVVRNGPEGAEVDELTGRDKYVEMMAGTAGAMTEYGFRPQRILTADNGTTVIAEVRSHFVLTPGDTPFGYTLVLLFDVNEQMLIDSVNIYWKTPTRRSEVNTVAEFFKEETD